MRIILISVLALTAVLSNAITATARVSVIIDRQATDNRYWLESAKLMKQIIETDDEDNYIIRLQVEISADIHSDGRNISTVVKISRQGKSICELVFKPVLFTGIESAAQNGKIMGRSVKKKLEELERICRLSYESSLDKAAFFIA